MKRLTHLNALRAFEIAARVGSFAKAAEELCVTPAAVSQQVRLLESYLGVMLFHRQGPKIGPTPEALQMLPDIALGFDRLARGLQQLSTSHRPSHQRIRLIAPSAFIMKWLVPRLQRFRSTHSSIDIHVDASTRAVDVASANYDLQVSHGLLHPGSEARSVHLFTDALFPVCSPSVAAELHPGRGLAQLATCRLIHDSSEEFSVRTSDWDKFLERYNVRNRNSASGTWFSDSFSATLAAKEGFGFLLGRRYIVDDDLQRGTLVRPFEDASLCGPTYHLVHRKSDERRPELVALVEWLEQEAVAYQRQLQTGHGAGSPQASPSIHMARTATSLPRMRVRHHAPTAPHD